MAERVRRQMVKGWKKPANTVYVGRPSRWGNPYRTGGQIHLVGKRAGQRADAAVAVDLYRTALLSQPTAIEAIRKELSGKNLMCWCKLGQPCHADVLLKVAAGELP